jgi:hypothetical protein
MKYVQLWAEKIIHYRMDLATVSGGLSEFKFGDNFFHSNELKKYVCIN